MIYSDTTTTVTIKYYLRVCKVIEQDNNSSINQNI